jgi:hypothetical protein
MNGVLQLSGLPDNQSHKAPLIRQLSGDASSQITGCAYQPYLVATIALR